MIKWIFLFFPFLWGFEDCEKVLYDLSPLLKDLPSGDPSPSFLRQIFHQGYGSQKKSQDAFVSYLSHIPKNILMVLPFSSSPWAQAFLKGFKSYPHSFQIQEIHEFSKKNLLSALAEKDFYAWVGGLTSVECDSLFSLSQKTLTPLICLNSQSMIQDPYLFQVFPHSEFLSSNLAFYAKKRNLKKIFALTEKSSFSFLEGFREEKDHFLIYHEILPKNFSLPFLTSHLKNFVSFSKNPKEEGLLLPLHPRLVHHVLRVLDYIKAPKEWTLMGHQEWRSPVLANPWHERFQRAFFVDSLPSFKDIWKYGFSLKKKPKNPMDFSLLDYEWMGFRAAEVLSLSLQLKPENRFQIPKVLEKVSSKDGPFKDMCSFDLRHRSCWKGTIFTVKKE